MESKRTSIKANFNTEFKISHNVTTRWHMEDFHFHDLYEIYYAMSDGVKYFVEDSVYEVEKGNIFIFNSMEIHKTIIPPSINYERCIILFKPDFIEGLSTMNTDILNCFLNRKPGHFNKISTDNRNSQLFCELIKKTQKYMQSNCYGSDIYRKIYLAEILLMVNSLYNLSTTECGINMEKFEYARVKPVIRYIRNNLNENLSLDKLAMKFYISRYHMGYLFKKATGFTINNYIINLRIIEAKKLLREGYSVSSVCETVGFGNVSHFIRTFKKYTGTSPKQYAKV